MTSRDEQTRLTGGKEFRREHRIVFKLNSSRTNRADYPLNLSYDSLFLFLFLFFPRVGSAGLTMQRAQCFYSSFTEQVLFTLIQIVQRFAQQTRDEAALQRSGCSVRIRNGNAFVFKFVKCVFSRGFWVSGTNLGAM